jgi:RNAse (barnase) inhibitor barstar
MKHLILDSEKFTIISEFYDTILELFPDAREYFGYNLDALYDILSDQEFERITLKWYQKIRFDLGDEFFTSLVEILLDLEIGERIVFEI